MHTSSHMHEFGSTVLGTIFFPPSFPISHQLFLCSIVFLTLSYTLSSFTLFLAQDWAMSSMKTKSYSRHTLRWSMTWTLKWEVTCKSSKPRLNFIACVFLKWDPHQVLFLSREKRPVQFTYSKFFNQCIFQKRNELPESMLPCFVSMSPSDFIFHSLLLSLPPSLSPRPLFCIWSLFILENTTAFLCCHCVSMSSLMN